ncbi:uncharacterized protein ycf36 [Lathyrus oleraceus]|uniref:Uncharacterized protein n=1 Tax=Pisum sativum TaxID=3888 RepID=A0A9D5A420_PEA|nr:uncharacterized protein ycf36 [Pisum sativum]KAI5393488.1 hypothetical protein KIW84_060571 [Pisum sativum]
MATTIPILMSPSTFKLSPSSTNTLFCIHTNKFITSNINNNRTKLLLLCLSSRNGTECPVPQEQQPINEYQSLSTSFPFSWAAGDVVEFGSRLFVVGFSFALFVGLPVAWFGTVGAQSEPAKRIVCAASSGILAVTFAVVRMYLGWAYVGNRLLSATVEYEETGWYDGQIWVKTAEVLTRDRLLGSFSVKPVLGRLKITLVGLAACLVTCALIFVNIDESYLTSRETGVRAIPGVYNDESARTFEPDAFRGEPDLQE